MTVKINSKYLLFAVVVLMFSSIPFAVFASVPAAGLVIEGVSVPGISIGDSRFEVENSYGSSSFCQSISTGDLAYCTYNLGGGDSVSVRYIGFNGGNAIASSTDVVSVIQWYGLQGWETSAGVNTASALSDPNSVINAYPNAGVTYNGSRLYSVRDNQLGIEVVWNFNPYPVATTNVSMSIFTPQDIQPPVEKVLRSTSVDIYKAKRQIVTEVTVEDESGAKVSGAVVSATWILPKGKVVSVSATTDSNGIAQFSTRKSRGTFRIDINNISKAGYIFDSVNSVLSAQI